MNILERALELACDDLEELKVQDCDTCGPCNLREACDAKFSPDYYIRKAKGESL